MIYLAVLFSFSLALGKDAWHLNATFEAKDQQIFDIPAKTIDPSFDKVSLLTKSEIIKKYKSEAKEDLKQSHAVFQIDKKQDSKKHRIVVGVYSGLSEKGSFLLVLEKQKQGWKSIFLHKAPGQPGFSVLEDAADAILWNTCLECGHSARLLWSKKLGYYFDTTPDHAED